MKKTGRYKVVRTKQFRKDLKRIKKSGRYDIDKLTLMIDTLASGRFLERKYKDHQLKGELSDWRECHIQGDWLLIYKHDKDVLVLSLLRTGSHAELFGK